MPAPVAAAAARTAATRSTAARAGASRATTAAGVVGMSPPRRTQPVSRSEPLFPSAPRRSRARRAGGGGASGTVMSGTRFVRLLKAEWLLCVVILGLSPLADPEGEESIGDALKRVAAATGVFFLLGLVAAAGPKPAKAAAGFGGLVTVALMLSSRDVFGTIAERLGAGFRVMTGAGDGQAGSALGGAAADGAQGAADLLRGGGIPSRVPDAGLRPPPLVD